MNIRNNKLPACFGVLDNVFPKGEDGLRNSPGTCMSCPYKTECLKSSMESAEALTVHEEIVDRAYESGIIGFFERWARKKYFKKKKRGDN